MNLYVYFSNPVAFTRMVSVVFQAAMRAYWDQGPHKEAMRQSKGLADVLEAYHWEDETFPDWIEAKKRLNSYYGRIEL